MNMDEVEIQQYIEHLNIGIEHEWTMMNSSMPMFYDHSWPLSSSIWKSLSWREHRRAQRWLWPSPWTPLSATIHSIFTWIKRTKLSYDLATWPPGFQGLSRAFKVATEIWDTPWFYLFDYIWLCLICIDLLCHFETSSPAGLINSFVSLGGNFAWIWEPVTLNVSRSCKNVKASSGIWLDFKVKTSVFRFLVKSIFTADKSKTA